MLTRTGHPAVEVVPQPVTIVYRLVIGETVLVKKGLDQIMTTYHSSCHVHT